MAKKMIRHLYAASDAVRSVLKNEIVTAACGNTKILTREGFEDGPQYKTCQDCITAVNGDYDEYTVFSPRGWTILLEKVWLSEHSSPKPNFYRFTIDTSSRTWNWPPAA
jgi:hypothetical protein